MAVIIRNEEHIKYENGMALARMEIDVDLDSELPIPAQLDGKKLCMGSTALIIKTGRLAILNGSGKWVDCKGVTVKE